MLCPCLKPAWTGCSQRVCSQLFARLDGWADPWYHEHKLPLLWSLQERILEIGPGTGANFSYYSPGTEVLAVEPNPYMHPFLRARAREFKLRLRIISTGAEAMPLLSGSVEHVVGTLVLCSVTSPMKVIKEIARVLKPGGCYHFVEHVGGEGLMKTFQTVAAIPWQVTFSGCHLNRNVPDLLDRSGAFQTSLVHLNLGPSWLPIRPHVIGRAQKLSS